MDTLRGMLGRHATDRGASAALLAPGKAPLSYEGLLAFVDHTARTLRNAGVSPRDRIALVAGSGPEAATASIALMAAAICLPIRPGLPEKALRFALQDGCACAIVLAADDTAAHRVARDLGLIVFDMRTDADSPAGVFDLAPQQSHRPAAATAWPGADDVALVLHTSGTTARPKRVPLTQANLLAGATTTARHLALSPADRGLGVMPLFHTHGLVGSLLSSITAGASVVVTPGFEAQHFFEWIAEFEPTWYSASPTIHQSALAAGAGYWRCAPTHRFRFVRSTSAALPPSTLRALEELFDAPVIEAYALSEAPGQIASNPLPPGPRIAGSVGLPTGAEIRVVDAAGNPVQNGCAGEVAVRGPGVIAGYEGSDSAPIPSGGWLLTGDQGHLDAQGRLFVSGRLKEIVNRGGEKLSPREVDEVLFEHPAVVEAAAFAAPHPTLGEDLLAAVVIRRGWPCDGPALRDYLAQRLPAHKVPSQVLLVEGIPRGPTGKIQRRELHEAFGHLAYSAYAAPTDDVERHLAEIWQSALKTETRVGIDDDFFALGGDSLLAVSMFVEVERRFGHMLRISTLFGAPTIRRLAEMLRNGNVAARSTVVTIQSEGRRPPVFFMPGWGSQILVFNELARALGNDQPLYAIDPTVIDVSDTALTVEEVAARIVADIRRLQPTGPYHLAGFSLGGKFAWEVAQQMSASGQRVSMLALLDTPAPGFPPRRPFVVRALLHLRHAFGLGGFGALRYIGKRALSLRRFFVAAPPALFDDGDEVKSSRLVQTMERSSVAMRDASLRYTPSAYQGAMMLVRASRRPEQPGVDDRDPMMGWGALARGGVAVRSIECAHHQMLDAAYSGELACVLEIAMRAA